MSISLLKNINDVYFVLLSVCSIFNVFGAEDTLHLGIKKINKFILFSSRFAVSLHPKLQL